jgi:hypothetical protein
MCYRKATKTLFLGSNALFSFKFLGKLLKKNYLCKKEENVHRKSSV